MNPTKISIIIPFHDEEQNVLPVLTEIRRDHPEAEVIAIDDGSRDRTYEILRAQPDIRHYRLARRSGQSAALYAGLIRAKGDVLVIIDGDGQSSASDIKRLLEYIPEYDLVNGRRLSRRDTPSRIAASWLANRVRHWVLRDGMLDSAGTPKVMKRECVEHLTPFDGMHRYIPALLIGAGFRVKEIDVSHRERLHGETKYTNLGRGWRGLFDLIGVRWLIARRIDVRSLDENEAVSHDSKGAVGRDEPPLA